MWSLPPTGPVISVRRRSIAMWMSSSASSKGNPPRRAPPRSGRALRATGRARSDVEHSSPLQSAGVGPRLPDVVGRKSPVEGERRVELPEDGVGLLVEAGHRRQSRSRGGSGVLSRLRDRDRLGHRQRSSLAGCPEVVTRLAAQSAAQRADDPLDRSFAKARIEGQRQRPCGEKSSATGNSPPRSRIAPGRAACRWMQGR